METPARIWMTLAALSGALAVCAGAFGAHGAADEAAKGWLRTGAEYQLVHAAMVFACAFLWRAGAPAAGWAAWLFLIGGLVFAGTLYLMALGLPRWLGAITPLGGLMLIAGWLLLAWAAFSATGRTQV
jgi:uncharacterized membrane protein YgdD (TMEM256/DUF423 family)